jgi:hypothetical protein
MICHDRANGLAGSEKEIGDVDLVLVKILGNSIAVLVVKLKVFDGVIFPDFLHGRIYQLVVHHIWLEDRKSFFGLQDVIDDRYDDRRKHKEKDSEELIFREKAKHSIYLGTKLRF